MTGAQGENGISSSRKSLNQMEEGRVFPLKKPLVSCHVASKIFKNNLTVVLFFYKET